MKSQWFKFKVIIFVLIAGIVVNTAIKSNNIKNSNIVENNKIEVEANKSEEIKINEFKNAETKRLKGIKLKQENLEKKWKIGYDEFFDKKYKQAIETERQVIKEDPNFYKAYAVEGIALAYSGNFKSGMQQIDQCSKTKT